MSCRASHANPNLTDARRRWTLTQFNGHVGVAAPRAQQCSRPALQQPSAAAALDALGGAEPLRLTRQAAPPGGDSPGAPADGWHLQPEHLKGCEPGGSPLRVAMLLSGGVDSSLALQLLCAAGHTPTAFYLQIWFQEDFANFWDSCPWEEDLQYCREVCERLGVPLEVVPLTQQYWDQVVAHSIAEIRVGRTPNPDMLCNSRVKFGAFLDYLETQHGERFDRVASGHYARLERGALPGEGAGGAAGGTARLQLTPDAVKDQTYFLAHLTPAQLGRALFPLGHLTKPEVRALAAAAALPNCDRKDSQGICFLGHVKFGEFVRQHLGEWPGPMLEAETGELLGYHRGFWFHTVGQRKGIHLSGGPWYVTEKDPDTNTVYVSRQYYEGEKRRDGFACDRFSWTTPDLRPAAGRAALQCKVRHGPNLYNCTLDLEAGADKGHVALDGNDQGLAPGQYVVFYEGGVCLGCATICAA